MWVQLTVPNLDKCVFGETLTLPNECEYSVNRYKLTLDLWCCFFFTLQIFWKPFFLLWFPARLYSCTRGCQHCPKAGLPLGQGLLQKGKSSGWIKSEWRRGERVYHGPCLTWLVWLLPSCRHMQWFLMLRTWHEYWVTGYSRRVWVSNVQYGLCSLNHPQGLSYIELVLSVGKLCVSGNL